MKLTKLDKLALVRAVEAERFRAVPTNSSSIYIPYWTYDAFSQSSYTGERGEHYYKTEHYTENGEQKSRQVRHTSW